MKIIVVLFMAAVWLSGCVTSSSSCPLATQEVTKSPKDASNHNNNNLAH